MSDDNLYRTPAADLGGIRHSNGMVDDAILEPLRKTKFWVQLVGVMLLIFAAFMAIATVMMVVNGGAMMFQEAGIGGAGLGIAMIVMYGFTALVYGYLGLSLFRYGKNIGRALESRSVEDVGNALNNQRGFWKVVGIFALITVVFMILMFVFGIGGMLIGMSSM